VNVSRTAHSAALHERSAALIAQLRERGFAFVDHGQMRRMLEGGGALGDWDAFAASWDALEPDGYLARLGRDRRRRHAVFTAPAAGPIERAPHQPHYQSLHYNPLQGDIERWFAPVLPEVGEGASLHSILRFAHGFFGMLAPDVPAWKIEVHQFRIEASAGRPGEPTPEGMHRDGVDYVLVLMVCRENIASGTTSIHDLQGRELGSFTLTRPLDAALVDDARVFHGITPVEALDTRRAAHRDVLVVTFKAHPTPDPL
jgi:hypothetical protein